MANWGIYKNGKLRVYKNGDWGSKRRINKMTVLRIPKSKMWKPKKREFQKQGGEGGEGGGGGGDRGKRPKRGGP